MLRLPVLLSVVPRLCVCRTERNDEILCYFGYSVKIWPASFIKSTRTSKGSRPLKSDGDVYSHPWDLQTQATLRAAKKNLTALGHANNFTKSLSNFYITYLNPRLTGGGGGVWRPPSRIFAIAQKRTALSTWNLAGLLIQQFDIIRGNFFEIRRKIFEIWSILWRHYTPLLVENWPNFAGLWKTQFLMKTQMKNTKRRKMRSSTRWLSRFFKILGFWPIKFQKIDFFGKWSLKSKIFKIFKKPEHMLFIY